MPVKTRPLPDDQRLRLLLLLVDTFLLSPKKENLLKKLTLRCPWVTAPQLYIQMEVRPQIWSLKGPNFITAPSHSKLLPEAPALVTSPKLQPRSMLQSARTDLLLDFYNRSNDKLAKIVRLPLLNKSSVHIQIRIEFKDFNQDQVRRQKPALIPLTLELKILKMEWTSLVTKFKILLHQTV